MLQGVGGHGAGHHQGGSTGYGSPLPPLEQSCQGFFCVYSCHPAVLIPIATQQAGTAAPSDIPGPQTGTKDL